MVSQKSISGEKSAERGKMALPPFSFIATLCKEVQSWPEIVHLLAHKTQYLKPNTWKTQRETPKSFIFSSHQSLLWGSFLSCYLEYA